MKKTSAIVLCICINALLIFFQVHKQSQIIKVLRDIQQQQKQFNLLLQKKRTLKFNIHQEQQPDKIKAIAQEQLTMKPISLKKVKSIQ